MHTPKYRTGHLATESKEKNKNKIIFLISPIEQNCVFVLYCVNLLTPITSIRGCCTAASMGYHS
jgi:hypothetical protein